MAHYNPEKRSWRGKSYKKGILVRDLKDRVEKAAHPTKAGE